MERIREKNLVFQDQGDVSFLKIKVSISYQFK